MIRFAFIFVFSLCSSAFVFGQTTDYKATLKKMFEVSGSEAAYKSGIAQMFAMFKQSQEVPPTVMKELEQEFMKTSMDDLVDMLVPVYEKHLTRDDLLKLIEFYQTPAGAKFAKKTPLIMQESMQIGQAWGMQIGQEFEKRLKEKGY